MANPKKSILSSLLNPDVINILGELAKERLQKLEELKKKEKAIAESRESETDSDEQYYAPSSITPKIKNKKKKKQITKKKSKSVGVHQVEAARKESIPEWLFNYMRRVNGFDPKHIINKNLFKTDLSRTHCRLSIPVKQVVEKDFLNEEELSVIEEESNKGIKAVLIDETMVNWDVELKRWEMSSTSTYVLVDGWTRLFQERGYEAGDPIRLWSFRANGILHFALVPPPMDARQARLPPLGDAGEARLPSLGDEGEAGLAPSGDAGQARLSPSGDVGEAGLAPSGDAGEAGVSPSGDAGQAGLAPSGDAGEAGVSPSGDAGEAGLAHD